MLLRSELDALPIKENTGLPYASKAEQVDADGIKKGVMHACAHDMHMACLLGVAELLYRAQEAWSGTLIVLFQPNEERLLGAKAMADDEPFEEIPLADVCLAQHCVPTKSRTIAVKPRPVLGYLDSLNVRVYGRGRTVLCLNWQPIRWCWRPVSSPSCKLSSAVRWTGGIRS